MRACSVVDSCFKRTIHWWRNLIFVSFTYRNNQNLLLSSTKMSIDETSSNIADNKLSSSQNDGSSIYHRSSSVNNQFLIQRNFSCDTDEDFDESPSTSIGSIGDGVGGADVGSNHSNSYHHYSSNNNKMVIDWGNFRTLGPGLLALQSNIKFKL